MNKQDYKSSDSPNKRSAKLGLVFAILVFGLFVIERIYIIVVSKLSMALAGGLARIILTGVPLFIATFSIVWALSYLYHWMRFKVQINKSLLFVAILVLIISIGGLSRVIYFGYLCSVAEKTDSKKELLAISQSSLATNHSNICRFIIENPNFDIQLALKMRKVSGCYLDFYFSSNPDTPSELLVELSQKAFCPSHNISLLLNNRNLPVEAKSIINKNCPEQIK